MNRFDNGADVAPDNYFFELMQPPTMRRGRGGNHHGKVRELRKKLLNQWCAGCGSRRASDEVVCQRCGTIIGEALKGPTRFARIPPEYEAMLNNSPGLRLRDIISFLVKTPRWKNGDLDEWVSAFAYGKQCHEQRRHGDQGGRPRGFGMEAGVKVQGRLFLWQEEKLREGGVSFAPGAKRHFSAVCLMAFDLYSDTLALFGRSREASSAEECVDLSKLVGRDDFDSILLATLERRSW